MDENLSKAMEEALQVTDKQARKHAEKYSWNACTDQFLQNLVRASRVVPPIYTVNFVFFKQRPNFSFVALCPIQRLLDWTAYLFRRAFKTMEASMLTGTVKWFNSAKVRLYHPR